MNSPHSADHGRPKNRFSQSEAVIFFLCGLMLGGAFCYLYSMGMATRERATNQNDVRLFIVGEIIPDKDGRYFARRDRGDGPPTALDIYVRNNPSTQDRWGYVFIGTSEALALWQQVEPNFSTVTAAGFAVSYQLDFGPICDPNKGFVVQTENGLTLYKGTGGVFTPHWRVVYLPPGTPDPKG